MDNVLISSCLTGSPCRYNASGCLAKGLQKLIDNFNIISVCPECMGGLPTPRSPSERVKNQVLSKEGKDVTYEFMKGAKRAVDLAKSTHCKFAILKEKSPSCGSHYIYDGSFTGNVIKGNGITAELLKKNGLECYSEDEIELAIEKHRKV